MAYTGCIRIIVGVNHGCGWMLGVKSCILADFDWFLIVSWRVDVTDEGCVRSTTKHVLGVRCNDRCSNGIV